MFCAFLSGEANAAFCPNLADHEGSRMHFGGSIFGSCMGFGVRGEGAGANGHLNCQEARLPRRRCFPAVERTWVSW